MHRPVGTPYYVDPSVLEGSYTQECDMWSIGVIAYMLLSGRPPFYGDTDNETLIRVRAGKFSFPPSAFHQVSAQAKDFISRLLVVDHTRRMTARQAQAHPWLHSWDQSPEPLHVDILGSLRNFHEFSTLKKVAMEVVAFSLRSEQIKDLRREFEKVDLDSNGEITLEELSQALEASGLLSPGDLETLVQGLDVAHQHAGTISWHEFLAATMDAALLDEEHIQLAFQRIDSDRTGYISQSNFGELVGADMTIEQVQEVFAEVDTDGDGKISYEEFVSLMKGTPPAPTNTMASGHALVDKALSKRNLRHQRHRSIHAASESSITTSHSNSGSSNTLSVSSPGCRHRRLHRLRHSIQHLVDVATNSPTRQAHAASHP